MAKIIPFKGLLYDTKKIADLDAVTAPPYDVISSSMQDMLYKKNEHNIVKIILNKEESGDNSSNNKYKRASSYLNEWMKKGILAKDAKPALYLYKQEYMYKSKLYKRKGLITLLKLENYENGVVFPHEQTIPKHKEDRLFLIRECKANLSQIFCLYSDPEKKIDAIIDTDHTKKERCEFKDSSGVLHSLTSIDDPDVLDKITKEVSSKKLYIADGHHRYETALNYRDEQRRLLKDTNGEHSFDYVMAYITNLDAEDMTILPTHRLLKGIEGFNLADLKVKLKESFDISEHKDSDVFTLTKKMNELGKDSVVFGMYAGNNTFYILKYKALSEKPKNSEEERDRLDVNILHDIILNNILKIDSENVRNQKNITFLQDETMCLDSVEKGESQAVFFLNSTKIDAMKRVVEAGYKMPQKTTFFYPKLISGLVINKFE